MYDLYFFKDPELGVVFYFTTELPERLNFRICLLCERNPVVKEALAGGVDESDAWRVMEALSEFPEIRIVHKAQKPSCSERQTAPA